MKSFQLQKETAPTTSGRRVRAVVLWALLGAVAGFMAYYPLAILMAGSTKAMIGTFEDWTLPAFVPLASLACAAIPFAAILRVSVERVEDWPRLLRHSLIVAAVALPVSSVLAILTFGVVRSSWQYAHDGVADWFMLSIPVATALAVVVSGLLRRDHAA
jgi:hypothetical protein